MATAAECAAHVCLSERRFREKLDLGIITRQPRDGYDLTQVREEYISHLQDVAGGRGGALPNGLDLTTERARLASEQADAQHMKNAVSRGDLLARGDVHVAVVEAFARVRAKLLALPTKLAPLMVGVSGAQTAHAIMTEAVHEALNELAATTVTSAPIEGEVNHVG